MVLSLTTFSQDSIRCFNVQQQKEILKKFVQLDECKELRSIDSTQIKTLTAFSDELVTKYTKLEIKAIRRKRMTFVVGGGGLLGGILLGLRLKP